jgi:hypothetical protein
MRGTHVYDIPSLCECIVSIINIYNGINAPIYGCQNCNTNVLVFGGYVKVGRSLHIQVIIWVNIIQNHIDTRVISLMYEDSWMVSKTKICSNTNMLLVSQNMKSSYKYVNGIKIRINLKKIKKNTHTHYPTMVNTRVQYQRNSTIEHSY